MILHKYKIIFIHIPKNAGSSIERYFGVKPFNWRTPNYETLTGWCPKRRLHLQHATPKQLLETDLIQEDIWEKYYKFTIVRNTWDRALSDYIWMMSDRNISGSFKDYLNRSGNFRHYLRDSYYPEYRGDHLTPQIEFTHIEHKQVLDNIYRFENVKSEFIDLCKRIGIKDAGLPHDKKSSVSKRHYSYYYNNKMKQLVSGIYKDDIDMFRFKFNDKKPLHEKLLFGSFRIQLFNYRNKH